MFHKIYFVHYYSLVCPLSNSKITHFLVLSGYLDYFINIHKHYANMAVFTVLT